MITPSGIPYPEIQVSDLVLLDLAGNQLAGLRRASIECQLHRAIYQARTDVQAIVHSHAVFTSAIAVTRQDFPPVLDTFVAVFGGGLKTAAYAGIGTEQLAYNAVQALGQRSGVLLANHGAICTGHDLPQAFNNALFLEASAQTYIFAHMLGQPTVLSPEVVDRVAQDLAQRYGQSGI